MFNVDFLLTFSALIMTMFQIFDKLVLISQKVPVTNFSIR